jgi:hypothetical protein
MDEQLAAAIAALGLPANTTVEPLVGGASESAWRIGVKGVFFVMRSASSPELSNGRLDAMFAARCAGLPAPELIKRSPDSGREVVLLSWLEGRSLFDVISEHPAKAEYWGRRMGLLQRRLHEVVAPDSMLDVRLDPTHPFAVGRDVPGLPDGKSVLHLDWHPLNLLVDEATDELSGIIDWDNARRGHPLLDLARTYSIFAIDPAVNALSPELRQVVQEVAQSWAEGYGPEASAIPPACHVWAGEVMLADLAARYPPEELAPVRLWTEGWRVQLQNDNGATRLS